LAPREQFGKRRNKEKERKKQKNGRKALTLTGLLMEGVEEGCGWVPSDSPFTMTACLD
jgi:hypothetical protein